MPRRRLRARKRPPWSSRRRTGGRRPTRASRRQHRHATFGFEGLAKRIGLASFIELLMSASWLDLLALSDDHPNFCWASSALLASPNTPVSNTKELVVIDNKEPSKINYSSGGPGTLCHLSGELFKGLTGTDLLHGPLRTARPPRTPCRAEPSSGSSQCPFSSLP